MAAVLCQYHQFYHHRVLLVEPSRGIWHDAHIQRRGSMDESLFLTACVFSAVFRGFIWLVSADTGCGGILFGKPGTRGIYPCYHVVVCGSLSSAGTQASFQKPHGLFPRAQSHSTGCVYDINTIGSHRSDDSPSHLDIRHRGSALGESHLPYPYPQYYRKNVIMKHSIEKVYPEQ